MDDRDLERVRQDLFTEIRNWMVDHERRDEERFDKIRAGQVEIQRTVNEMNGRVGRMNAEIGFGLPEPEERGDRLTIRKRLHNLENGDMVAKAIHDSYARTFARWQKVALFGFAGAAAVEGFLRIVGVGG